MSQSVLFVAIHLVGLAVCLAIGPRRVPALCCALAFPIGLAVTVLLALAILLIGVPYGPWTLGPAMAATATASAIAAARRGLDRRDLVVVGWWTLAFAIVCPAVTHVNIATFSPDSHTILGLGFSIANLDGLTPGIMAVLDKQGVFQIVAHSTFELTRRDYLYSLPLVLGIAFAPMFALILWHGLGAVGAAVRRRSALVALVTAAVFTMSMVDYHILYIHTNLGSAVYLFGFVALFWIAEVRGEPEWLPLAFVSLIAFALHRTETPLVALLFLALTLTQTELPRRTVTGWLALFTATVAIWYEALAHHVDEKGFITPGRSRLVWGLLVVFFVWWLLSGTRVVRRVNRAVPALVAAGCALAMIAAFAMKPDHMLRSSVNWASNLIQLPHWGNSWIVIPVLILLGLAVAAPRFRVPFAVGLPVYAGVILLLSFSLPKPWRMGLGDSANRMTIHLLPLIFFYLGIKLLPILLGPAGSDDRAQRSDATAGP